MAYGLKYVTQFYDSYGEQVVINIYKEGYASSTVDLRSSEASITYNNGGFLDPIISLSADVTIVHTLTPFNTLDDLLKNQEKQFKAIITRAGQQVFDGFLVCDTTEQQLLEKGTIQLTFTDYLKRLQDTEFTALELGVKYSLLDILQTALALTGLDYTLYVNCRLFPEDIINSASIVDTSAGNTLFEQVFVDGDIFYSTVDKIVSAFDVISDILKSFSCRLYTFNGAWYIERYDELLDDTTLWTKFESDQSTETNKFASYNRQAGDFVYVDMSQVRSFISGLKTFEVKLNDILYDSLVYNNAPEYLPELNFGFDSDDIVLRTWYIYHYGTLLASQTGFYDIDKSMSFEEIANNRGIYYRYKWTWNSLSVESDYPTTMNISWKQYVPSAITDHDNYIVYGRFYLMACKDDVSILTDKYLRPAGDTYDYGDDLPDDAASGIFEIEVYKGNFKNRTVEFDMSLDLSKAEVSRRGVLHQEYVLAILPMGYKVADGTDDVEDNVESYLTINTVGDVVVNVNSKIQNNSILATLDDNFIKKDSVELKLFDTFFNYSLKNGLYLSDDQNTRYWTDDLPFSPSGDYYLHHFIIRSAVKYSSVTRSSLNASIRTTNIMKPLSALYDDNMLDSDESDTPFILSSYTYNLATNICSINAEEYGQEPIVIIE